ncbi:MAG: TRAP transporter large permease subunit [Rhodospirillales bacterium]|nr:TRAP transporter large permease subunit [Rhodospirillales bacterium]
MAIANHSETLDKGGAPGFYRRLANIFTRTISILNSVGTLWVFALMFLICADIIARAFYNVPIRGVPEIVGYSLIGALYLQLAHSLHVGRFARAEMFIEPLSRKRPITYTLFQIIFSLGGIFVFGLIAFGAITKFEEAWPDLKFGVEGDFTVLVWPLRLIIFIGSVMVAVKYLSLFIENLFEFRRQIIVRMSLSEKEPLQLYYLLIILGLFLGGYFVATGDLSKVAIGAFSLIGMLVVIFMGIHIGVGLILLGFAGIWMMMGTPTIAINAVKLASNEFLRSYFFGVIPLFVLMGLIVNESEIGGDTFDVARWVLRKVKGGLGVATVIANAIFAAITGSSIASAAVFTKVAVPHMMKHGYTPKFAVGTVAGSSILGMLIPPSLLLIIYGFVAEQSVGLLFLAAVIPGIILAIAMSIAIIGMAHFWPSYVGRPSMDYNIDMKIGTAAWMVLPIIILVVAVLGGIYGGIFTPVEAGAVGAAGALILSIIKRRLTWPKLWKVLMETGHTTVSVLFLILAANIYARMLALSGLPQTVSELIGSADLGFMGFLILYLVLVIILGMFLDSISIMLIILPLVLPIVLNFGGDLVWFGIVTVIAVEMGLLTPPLGIAVYVVKSTISDASITLNQIFAGAFPYVVIMFLVTILLIVFPQLSLFLLNS